MTKDWLNEVLAGFHTNIIEGFTYTGPKDVDLAEIYIQSASKAHKLISAQLIRERIETYESVQTMLMSVGVGENKLAKLIDERTKDLTNKLKEVEDEN